MSSVFTEIKSWNQKATFIQKQHSVSFLEISAVRFHIWNFRKTKAWVSINHYNAFTLPVTEKIEGNNFLLTNWLWDRKKLENVYFMHKVGLLFSSFPEKRRGKGQKINQEKSLNTLVEHHRKIVRALGQNWRISGMIPIFDATIHNGSIF